MRGVAYQAARDEGIFPVGEAPADGRLDTLIQILLAVFGGKSDG